MVLIKDTDGFSMFVWTAALLPKGSCNTQKSSLCSLYPSLTNKCRLSGEISSF